jgi:hypothetical protein
MRHRNALVAYFIEEFSAHCLQKIMPTGTFVTEIPLSRRAINLPERFHIAPAKGALSNEADIAKVQEWLGHANVSTTGLSIPSGS